MELPAPSCGSKRSISGRADEGRSLPATLIGGAAKRGRSHQAVESASAAHDANHLDALGQKPTEDQVVADRKEVAKRTVGRAIEAEVSPRAA
jgi:IS5 family transposase